MQRLRIDGHHKAIARQFHLLTRGRVVSVNEFREYRLHTLLKNRNQTGAFFDSLIQLGVLIKTGDKVKAKHKAARGRLVNSYVWSFNAAKVLGVYDV